MMLLPNDAWCNIETTALGGQSDPFVTVLSPLGRLGKLQDWDMGRASGGTLVERYNLVGHGFAKFIFDVVTRAGDVLDGEMTVELAVDRLINKCDAGLANYRYIQNLANRMRVVQELNATIDALKDDRPMEALTSN